MLGSKVRVMDSKAIAIMAMVVVIVFIIDRPMVGPIPWIPVRSRGIRLISLKGINQGHLVITSIGLARLS